MSCKPIASFTLLVSYYQISVFDGSMERPFNDWHPEHNRQGFAWRPGSVTFATLASHEAAIQVVVCEQFFIRTDAVRVIRVPFLVAPRMRLQIATTAFEYPIVIPPNRYALHFEHGLIASEDEMWCTFSFVPDQDPAPAILVADKELAPPRELIMTADPA